MAVDRDAGSDTDTAARPPLRGASITARASFLSVSHETGLGSISTSPQNISLKCELLQ